MPEARQASAPQAPGIEPIPASPPDTKTPVQLNTQINVYQQIPANVWERFTPEEALRAIEMLLVHAEQVDKRHFDFAMDQARKAHASEKARFWLGTAAYALGYCAAVVLALYSHPVVGGLVAATITGSLLTVFGKWVP